MTVLEASQSTTKLHSLSVLTKTRLQQMPDEISNAQENARRRLPAMSALTPLSQMIPTSSPGRTRARSRRRAVEGRRAPRSSTENTLQARAARAREL